MCCFKMSLKKAKKKKTNKQTKKTKKYNQITTPVKEILLTQVVHPSPSPLLTSPSALISGSKKDSLKYYGVLRSEC